MKDVKLVFGLVEGGCVVGIVLVIILGWIFLILDVIVEEFFDV